MNKVDKNNIYKVTFYNQSTVYEIYAKKVSHDSLYGFVEVSEFVFGSNANIVVDPSEERLKTEFLGVNKTLIPMHSISRIDVVEKEGVSKICEPTDKSSNITQFPVPMYKPPPDNKT